MGIKGARCKRKEMKIPSEKKEIDGMSLRSARVGLQLWSQLGK